MLPQIVDLQKCISTLPSQQPLILCRTRLSLIVSQPIKVDVVAVVLVVLSVVVVLVVVVIFVLVVVRNLPLKFG